MLIFVKIVKGRTIGLEVTRSNTVEDVKTEISDIVGIRRDEQRLIYADTLLEDSKSLADYNIQSDSTIHLLPGARGSMRIIVKTITGRTFPLEVESSYTTEKLMAMIWEMLWIPTGDQRIIFDGRQLYYGKTLAYYNIENGSTIHVLKGIPNGMEIFVKTLMDKTISLWVKCTDEVESVKDKIQDKWGVLPQHQTLIFGSAHLEDDKRLFEYNIKEESTILLVLYLRGSQDTFRRRL